MTLYLGLNLALKKCINASSHQDIKQSECFIVWNGTLEIELVLTLPNARKILVHF